MDCGPFYSVPPAMEDPHSYLFTSSQLQTLSSHVYFPFLLNQQFSSRVSPHLGVAWDPFKGAMPYYNGKVCKYLHVIHKINMSFKSPGSKTFWPAVAFLLPLLPPFLVLSKRGSLCRSRCNRAVLLFFFFFLPPPWSHLNRLAVADPVITELLFF